MKKLICFIVPCLLFFPGQAQSTDEFMLAPGSSLTLPVNGKTELVILQLDASGDPVPATSIGLGTVSPQWLVNGHNGDASNIDGNLTTDLTFLKATYTAPSKVPAKNPVAVSVRFKPSDNSKTMVTLVCNVRIVQAQYKVSMQAEVAGPKGIHYAIHGEAFANLNAFADGTYGLMPADGTKNMHVTLTTATEPNMALVVPASHEYDIPFVINVGNIASAKGAPVPAKVSIETLSPTHMGRPYERYMTPAGPIDFPGRINNYFTSAFYQSVYGTETASKEKLYNDLQWAKRLQAHQNDPSYFQTAQGKADLLAEQKFMQEHGMGNMYKEAGSTPTNANAYSKAFVKGIQETQVRTSASAHAPGAGTPSVAGGFLHFDGTFNTNQANALKITSEGEAGGALHGTIVITVEKLQ